MEQVACRQMEAGQHLIASMVGGARELERAAAAAEAAAEMTTIAALATMIALQMMTQ